MEQEAVTNYTWWIDPFNELHVDYNKKEANSELKFDNHGKYVLSYNGDIQKRWHEKEASEQKTSGVPKVQLTPATRINAKGEAVAATIETRFASNVQKDAGSKDKSLIKYGSWSIALAGHHLMAMNTCVNIKDFADIDPDGVYQLCGLDFSDANGLLSTVMTFRSDFRSISAKAVQQKESTTIGED